MQLNPCQAVEINKENPCNEGQKMKCSKVAPVLVYEQQRLDPVEMVGGVATLAAWVGCCPAVDRICCCTNSGLS